MDPDTAYLDEPKPRPRRPPFGDEQEIEAIRKAMELDQQTGVSILCYRDHLTHLMAAIDRRDAALAELEADDA